MKKHNRFSTVLCALQEELSRLSASNNGVHERLISYMMGKKDYYKIIKYENHTEIKGYNMYGYLESFIWKD